MQENALQKAAEKQEVAKRKPKPVEVIGSLLTAKSAEIRKALPSVMTAERFTRIALTTISTNPTLAEAAITNKMSFIGAAMTAAQLGLEPNTPLGHCYLIPRRRKGAWEVQFQIGYKGLIDLAYRSGEVAMIYAHCVYENDHFEYQLGLEPKLIHVPARGNRGQMTHVYGVWKSKSGASGFSCWSREDIESHRDKYSDAAKSAYSPWSTQFEDMAKKTVLKDALKYAPLKSDFVRQLSNDDSVKTELAADMSEVIDVVDVEASPTPSTESVDITPAV